MYLRTGELNSSSGCGLSLPSRALPAISLTEVEMSSRPRRLVLLNTGAMRPWSVWTAKDMLTFLYYLMYSVIQELLVSGTLIAAIDAALMTKSLTESLVEDTLGHFVQFCSKIHEIIDLHGIRNVIMRNVLLGIL